jgi:hypothetical protein
MIKKKKVTVDFIFSEKEFDLNIITEDWIHRVLKQKGFVKEGEEPEAVVHPIEEFEEE